jgi:RHS repeat-associated protein
VDAAGAVAQKLDYLPFGDERVNVRTGAFDAKHTFTDQEKDAESGLLYYGARYYNSRLGRFTSVDPVVRDNVAREEFALALANPQFLNAYSYGGNNPLQYADEDGEFAFLLPLAVYIQITAPVWAPWVITGVSSVGGAVASWYYGAALGHYSEGGNAEGHASIAKEMVALEATTMAVGGVIGVAAVGGRSSPKTDANVSQSLQSVTPEGKTDSADQALYYGQKTISSKFGEEGPFAKQRLSEVVNSLRSGKTSPDQLPIEYIVRDGKQTVLNNRSLNVLQRAGMEPTKLIDRTGIPRFEKNLTKHLRGAEPSRFIRVRGAGPNASLIK